MRNLKAVLLLLLMFCAQNFKSQNILRPEKVFNLYFDSFIKYDNESLKELNSYLINFLGKDNIYTINADKNYSSKVESYTNIFLANLSGEMADACKTEAKNYFSVLINNFKDAQYRIKSIKSVQNKNQAETEIAEVIFEVTMKVPSDNSDLKINDMSKIDAQEMKKYLTNLTARLKNADKMISTEQKFNLYEMKNNSEIFYWNGGPEELSWKLNEFYLKNLN